VGVVGVFVRADEDRVERGSDRRRLTIHDIPGQARRGRKQWADRVPAGDMGRPHRAQHLHQDLVGIGTSAAVVDIATHVLRVMVGST